MIARLTPTSCPPIPYPDGYAYLKIGIGTEADKRLISLLDLQDWFKSTDSADNQFEFTALLKNQISPLTSCAQWHSDTRAVTKTASGFPVIDFVHDDRIVVAVGGCGKGGNGSD